jgi:hypothetical protein
MALTDIVIRKARPESKALKFADGGELYLLLNPNGSRWWRLDYRFDGKRKTLSLGIYPVVTLAEARARRDEAKKLLANGVDPGAVKKAQKQARHARAANSFEAITREWFEKWETEVTASTAKSQRERLAKHIMPVLGAFSVADIDVPKILCRP